MAYRDSEGRITIDEVAAMADVMKEAAAVAILREARQSLLELIAEAQTFKGETALAIVEKAEEQERQVSKLIDGLEEAQAYTKRVVEHYKIIDQKCKEIVSNM